MAQRIFTSFLVFVLFLFNVSGQSERMINIKFELNNTVPPSYTFKADFAGNAVSYLWHFSDNTLYEESSPVHTFKKSGNYGVTVKITDEPGNVYYGRTSGHFLGANTTVTVPQYQRAKGWVKDLSSTDGCGLVIVTDGREVFLPVEILPKFRLEEGQQVEFTFEFLRNVGTICMAGKPIRIHRIKVLKENNPTDRCQVKLTYFPVDRSNKTYRFLARSNAPVEKWEWNFGDGNSSNSPEPVYTYNAPGIYNVECTILTADGCEATGTITVIVKEILPVCPGGLTLTLFDPESDRCNGEAHVTMFDQNGDEYENVRYLWSTGEEGNSVLTLCPDIPYYIHAIVEGVCQKNTSFTFLSKPRWRVNRTDRTYTFEVINPVTGTTYFWNFGDGNSAVGESASNNFEKSGEYNVSLTAVMGASSVDAQETISVETTLTGIDRSHVSDFTVFPNPAKDLLYIDTGSLLSEITAIEISDIQGRKLLHHQFEPAENALSTINIQSLSPGIYFIRLVSGNRNLPVKKLIITDR